MAVSSTLPLETWDTLAGKNVLVRIDANVPLVEGKIVNDFKLVRACETITYIKNKGGTSIIITHIGHPTAHDPALSTQALVPWFKAHGFNTVFAATYDDLYVYAHTPLPTKPDCIIFENIRFWPEEYTQDRTLACRLAQLGNYYVNDAFGSLHRAHTSLTTLALCFDHERRSRGFLIAAEINQLSRLKNPTPPFLVLSGGNKVTDKVQFLRAFAPHIDTLILCPALCFSYYAAQTIPVGQSFIDADSFDACTQLRASTHINHKTKIITPSDFLVFDRSTHTLTEINYNSFTPSMMGLSLGSRTVTQICDLITQAHTIFFNGPFGLPDYSESMAPLTTIIRALARASAYTVAAGGDTVSAIARAGYQKDFSFLSTGGGASLAFLSNSPLPGLTALTSQAHHPCIPAP